ncbi:MAG: peptide-methionine (S)-S-oxide reductase MsrA [bacterium]
MELEKATFAAGCFWGVQAAFDKVDGVVRTTVGYTGGQADNPDYRQVCTGETGHAEAVLIDFDPARVGYERLLEVFWSIHDPTTRNRQGPDVGSQYRSAIYSHSEAQRQAALESLRRVEESGRFRRPVVTEVASAAPFWPAEEYHQKYFAKRGGGACHTP